MTEKKANRIKMYGVVIGIVSLAFQHGIYLLGHALAGIVNIPPYLPKIDVIDGAIPIFSVFIIPYVWAYIFWAMAPMVVSKCEENHFWDYIASYLFACIFGATILVFAPTYMDRVAEGLFDYSKTGFCNDLMRFWYSLDGGKMAYNLLPSFHCINSVVCYLGVSGRKEIPYWFRVYSLVIMLLILASTMFVKQHYFLDVVTGSAIGAVSFLICKKLHAGRIFTSLISFVKRVSLYRSKSCPRL